MISILGCVSYVRILSYLRHSERRVYSARAVHLSRRIFKLSTQLRSYFLDVCLNPPANFVFVIAKASWWKEVVATVIARTKTGIERSGV